MKSVTRFKRGLWFLVVSVATGACATVWLTTPVHGTAPLAQQGDKPAPAPPKVSEMVVHEWGTFLGMSSADGTALDGMYHEEHALPAFVHGRNRDQLKMPMMFLKGETPVIYFYTKTPQKVRVGVGFPRGIWTQWYPQASLVVPSLATQAEQAGKLANGRICWFAEIIPRSELPGTGVKPASPAAEINCALPATSTDALWNHAREVDAAFVKTIDAARPKPAEEYERFLFYRGLGDATLPLRIEESSGGTLTLPPLVDLAAGVRDIFVLRVEGGRGAYSYRASLRPGESASGVIPSMDEALPLPEFAKKIGDDLAGRLAGSGLFSKEARAMVNTWRSSYFETDGIRVLFVLPQSWTDAFIPMTIEPRPRKIVRVMVGRLEMLSTARQQKAEAAIASFASGKPGEIARAYRFLYEQGRYLEPIVRHVGKTSRDESVKALCSKLLLTDFVTNLRAALNNASDGKTLKPDALCLHGQLARLLRQVGQVQQARAEASAVLAALPTYPVPQGQKHENAPAVVEIRATALEGSGDDEKAAEAYARRVELAARGMPAEMNESQIPGLRDWWVGRAYAACTLRSKRAVAIESDLRASIARQADAGKDCGAERTARMLLAFLLDEQGKQGPALSQWRSMVTVSGAKAASVPTSKPAAEKTGI